LNLLLTVCNFGAAEWFKKYNKTPEKSELLRGRAEQEVVREVSWRMLQLF